MPTVSYWIRPWNWVRQEEKNEAQNKEFLFLYATLYAYGIKKSPCFSFFYLGGGWVARLEFFGGGVLFLFSLKNIKI